MSLVEAARYARQAMNRCCGGPVDRTRPHPVRMVCGRPSVAALCSGRGTEPGRQGGTRPATEEVRKAQRDAIEQTSATKEKASGRRP